MKKINGLVISDAVEHEMVKCVNDYGIYMYTAIDSKTILLYVLKPELLEEAISAQNYLNTVCPVFKWFAALGDWYGGEKIVFVNCAWMEW